MNMDTHLPTTSLRPLIKSYLIIESWDERVNSVLPDTAPTIAFQYKGQVNYVTNHSQNSLPTAVVSGLQKSVRRIQYTEHTGNIIVLFKETGASAFFKTPIHELFEASVSLDNFMNPHELSMTEEQLVESNNNYQRIAVIEQFLLSKLYKPEPDKLIAAALQEIHAAKGIIKIKELANALYISQDAFEKRFRKTVGASPKQFASIVRMKYIIHRGFQNQNFADIAFDADYFDQSHFNKDFKIFTGKTPTDFLNHALHFGESMIFYKDLVAVKLNFA